MIDLPDPSRAFEFENGFYLTSHPSRLAKLLAQFELFKLTAELAGDIVECGVFKGASLVRLITYRNLLLGTTKKVIGFDTFGAFPPTSFEADERYRQAFLEQAGDQSIGVDQLREVLEQKGLGENVELVVRRNQRTVILSLLASEPPVYDGRESDRLGLVVRDLTPYLKSKLRIEVADGVVVWEVKPRSR